VNRRAAGATACVSAIVRSFSTRAISDCQRSIIATEFEMSGVVRELTKRTRRT
jgi:hypothetical protein